MNMNDKHVADYFIIAGVSENPQANVESKPLINSVLPITDITVIFKGHGEECPAGYTCLETTPNGHSADLNNGNFRSPQIHICYRRGNDKPPLVEVGVYYEEKERLLPECEAVYETPYGRYASTAGSNSKSGTFILFRRAKTNPPFNQAVVVDLCVILNNKSENPPRTFLSTKKNLNKSISGMIGSEVFLCYKKTLLSPPSICYTPQIISRFPLQDYPNFPLPETVPLFCLPTGANIEVWPSNISPLKPTASTFVLTSDSAQKIYGSCLSFYEPFDRSALSTDQKYRLGLLDLLGDDKLDGEDATYAIKSICILSRWPFFECYDKFLSFLHKLANPKDYRLDSLLHRNHVPLEHYISHFLLDVSFPTSQRPTVLVQLMPGTDEEVVFCQPSSRLPLPLTGASFTKLLRELGVDNTVNVLLFGLSEQKILLHSLQPSIITGIAEAVSAMLFPFHWQCPYVPLCPLSLHGILNAPLPFIVGVDSRCFDTFTPPDDLVCIDLDTSSIYLSEMKRCLNLKLLPKRAARVLRNSLEKIHSRLLPSPVHQSPMRPSDSSKAQVEKKLELEIQEAFVRFMATILRGFRSYLLPITRAPTAGSTDPTSLFDFEGFLGSRDRNYGQFYQLITKTQMFTHYIEERSFLSDKDTSLAFFDDCEEKLSSSSDIFSDRPIKLFEIDESLVQKTDRSVYIPAPEQSPSISTTNDTSKRDVCDSSSVSSPTSTRRNNIRFGPLNSALFHRHPQIGNHHPVDKTLNNTTDYFAGQSIGHGNKCEEPNSSFSRRTKQEVKTCKRKARKSAENPLDWSKYLLSCCYSLWFSTLPFYLSYCKQQTGNNEKSRSDNATSSSSIESHGKNISRILRYAYSTIVRMQKLDLTTDEMCFRVLTILCCHHGQPALAVRVFFEMKKAGIKPNAITYGYYNKAVLESEWPDHSTRPPTTVLWTKIRNVISGIVLFKSHGRTRMARRNIRSPIQSIFTDPNLYLNNPDSMYGEFRYNVATGGDVGAQDLFRKPEDVQTIENQPASKANEFQNPSKHKFGSNNKLRRSSVNRSFSSYSKHTSSQTCDNNHDDNRRLNLDNEGILCHPLRNPKSASSIQKSHSMHLREDLMNFSPLTKTKSSSLEDEEEACAIQTNNIKYTLGQTSNSNESANLELLRNIEQKYQLLDDPHFDQTLSNNIDLLNSPSGVLFTTCRDIKCFSDTNTLISSSLLQPIDSNKNLPTNNSLSLITKAPHDNIITASNNTSVNQSSEFLRENASQITNTNEFLKINSFGEDEKILLKLESMNEDKVKDLSVSADCLDESSTEDTKSNKLSESMGIEGGNLPGSSRCSTDGYGNSMKSNTMTSTPNFKLSDLINDAASLQWSNWASSQNSSSVYKGIKNAATGIVSSLQEIKSSFSISNSNTPSKLLTSAHQIKSTATREMLSQWANYFSSQPPRGDDEDYGSLSGDSMDLKLSSDEEGESSANANRINDINNGNGNRSNNNRLFEALEKYYCNPMSNEDLLNHVSDPDDMQRISMEIRITTCSRCNTCHSLLYDEEIMDRWSYNESNLNTKCIYCRAKIVPLMHILVNDRRFECDTIRSDEAQKQDREHLDMESRKTSNASSIKENESYDLVDLNSETDVLNNEPSDSNISPSNGNCRINDIENQINFTVPYLSPIVLRKELESVFESSGSNSAANSNFVDEHPIIFWNLLWYFSRINLPTHLAMLCLDAKSILNNRTEDQLDRLKQHKNSNVLVRTLWDNEKLHAEVGKPLYRFWKRGDPSAYVDSILCDKLYLTRSSLDQVINLIKTKELLKAMNLVLNARLKSSAKFSFDKNRHNMHRDLMFLSIIAVGQGNLRLSNFEREYKKAFEVLNFQQVALNRFDRPPTIRSLFCKKAFRELSLID